MTKRTVEILAVVVGVALLGAGCVGESPFSPSDTSTSVLEGPSITVVPTSRLVATPGRVSSEEVRLSAVSPTDPITVTVQEVPSISTTVNPGETAIITGLPPGAYTLLFSQNGSLIGTQNVFGFQPGQQIQITVVFEGDVFVFVVVIIGNNPTPPPSPGPCTIDGQSVGSSLNVEGDVVSGNGTSFRMERKGTHGRALYDVNASGATYKCVGQAKGNCQANLATGAQVHVKGTLLGCFADSVAIAAVEVKVQKP